MSHQGTEVFCAYPPSRKLTVALLLLPLALVGLLLAGATAQWLAITLVRLVSGTPLGPEPLLIGIVTISILFFPALFTNLYTDIRLSQKGINVQVFWLRWVFVPWENVLDIRPTLQSRLFGHRRTQLVIVRRLTLLHRCIGWSYGWTLKPAFIIWGAHTRYDEAVQLIRRRLGKQETRSMPPVS